jgi:putative membrane protein
MQDGSDDQDRKTDWAEYRTDWAEDRTILANERTFAGWMRTGMAAIAIAVGLKAVFGEADPPWLPKLIATVFIAASLMIFISAWRKARDTQTRLKTHDTAQQPVRNFGILAVIFSAAAVLVGGILWTL